MYGQGVDWPISYDDLEPYYGQAEIQMGVSGNHEEWNGALGAKRTTKFPMPMIWPSYLETTLKAGLEGKEIEGKKLKCALHRRRVIRSHMRTVPPAQGIPVVFRICPIGSEIRWNGAYVKKAVKNGVKIIYEAAVQENRKR